MLRKTTALVVLAGALALGTASATSLGTFDDVSFAASDIGLLTCTADSIELVPDVPELGDDVSTVETFTLGSIIIDFSDATAAVCIDELADIALLDSNGVVLDVATDVTLADNTEISLGLTSDIDIALITDVHIVVHG